MLIIHAFMRGDGNPIAGLKEIYEKNILCRTIIGDPDGNFTTDENVARILRRSIEASVGEVLALYFDFNTAVLLGFESELFVPMIVYAAVVFVLRAFRKENRWELYHVDIVVRPWEESFTDTYAHELRAVVLRLRADVPVRYPVLNSRACKAPTLKLIYRQHPRPLAGGAVIQSASLYRRYIPFSDWATSSYLASIISLVTRGVVYRLKVITHSTSLSANSLCIRSANAGLLTLIHC